MLVASVVVFCAVRHVPAITSPIGVGIDSLVVVA
jgi:hypothetical protein